MKPTRVTDVEYELVDHRLVVPWGRLIWWGTCVAGAAAAAYDLSHRGEVVVIVISAAILWPLLSMTASLGGPRLSEESAALLRSRLLGRPATIWAKRGGHRAQGSGRPAR